MVRRLTRPVVVVPFIALLLVGATVYFAARPVASSVRDSTAPAEETATSKSPVRESHASGFQVEELPAYTEEEEQQWRRMDELDSKSRRGESLTETEDAERWYLLGNHLTREDKRAIARLDKVEQMPRTKQPDFRPIPEEDKKWSEARWVHSAAQFFFENASGFGSHRMNYFSDGRGGITAHPAIDRVELVGLLTSSEPNAYVIDTMATPRTAKAAKRRTLDAFESAALGAIQKGENLVYSPVEPTRMFGAIRAGAVRIGPFREHTDCLRCHSDKREGDLLGAFTYWLKKPVDQLK